MVDKSIPPGGGKSDKLIRDALLAAMRQSPQKLKKGAEALLEKLEAGDDATWRFAADRIDGKVTDKVELSGPDGGPIVTQDSPLDKAALDHYMKTQMERSNESA